MKKEMLINALLPEETRIAIVENGVLEELYVERVANENIVGNIYKGRIVNIEPSIQAVFVDFGIGRNGFLHISDVDPSYYEKGGLIEEIKDPTFGSQKPTGERDRERPVDRERSEGSSRGGRSRSGGAEPEDRESRRPPRDQKRQSREPRPDDRDRRRPTPPVPPADDFAPIDEEEVESIDPFAPRDEASESETGGPKKKSRRRRGRGRGRGKGQKESQAPESAAPDDDAIPEEIIEARSSELPDLENYRIEDDEELHEEFVHPRAAAEPLIEEESPLDDEPESDDFGFGLIEDSDEDDDDGRPLPPDAVYRRTDRDDDDDFGQGIFGEEEDDSDIDEDEDDEVVDEIEEEVEAEIEASDDEESDDLDEETAGPHPRQSRYDDEDLFAGFSAAEDDEEFTPSEPIAEYEPDTAPESEIISPRSSIKRDEEEEVAPPRRPRNRRGGRRNDEEEAPYPRSRRVEPSFDDDDLSPGPRDDDEEEPRPRSHSRGRDRGSDRGDRGRGGNRRGGPQGRRGPQQQRWNDPRRPKDRPPIQEVFRRGQEVVVQVIKEGVGNKGPTLSTYISIPGRCLVAMPGLDRVGVSRKIVDPVQRRRLRDIMTQIDRPSGVGFIVRTAGVDRSHDELERDLAYLSRLWEVVVKRTRHQPAPTVVYQESDVIIRTIRDIFNQEIDAVWIDEKGAFDRAREFMRMVMPDFVERVKLYEDLLPMFNKFHIEEEIFKIQQRTVPLEKGGSIVIEQAEALVAIDVNSGNFRAEGNAEETAFQMNLAAAKEIARQLRLRDLGGVIVNDFIDMREEKHRRQVENTLREAIRRDRAKTKVLRMSAFGLIEMTRQRIRPSLKRSLYHECLTCGGTGHVKTVESMSIDCMRLLTYLGQSGRCRSIQMLIDSPISEFLNNHKRKALTEIEDRWRVSLNISGKQMTSPEEVELHCFDGHGHELNIDVTHLMHRSGRPLKH
jgi:ribonuclease E